MTEQIQGAQPADGGPAFPVPDVQASEPKTVEQMRREARGMSLRDYLAIHATDDDVRDQGEILRAQIRGNGGTGILPDDWRVRARYLHADAMLKARGGAA